MAKTDFHEVWHDKKRTLFGLPLSFTSYYLTETKLITRTGFLNLVEDEIDLYKITDKKLALPLSQRIFGCGTVVVYSRDTDSPQKSVGAIKDPRGFMEILEQHVNAQRDRYGIRGRDMVGATHSHDYLES